MDDKLKREFKRSLEFWLTLREAVEQTSGYRACIGCGKKRDGYHGLYCLNCLMNFVQYKRYIFYGRY